MLRLCPVLFVSLVLSACTAMPVSSIYALSKVDVMTTDLARLRIALAVPAALRPRPEGVMMEVKVASAGQPPETRMIRLEESSEAADRVGLQVKGEDGQHVHTFRLTADGIAELQDIRNKAAANKAQNKKGSLEIGVAAREFCRTGDLPPGHLSATTWMATSETQSYVVLVRDYDLREDPKVAQSLTALEECSGQ